MPDVRGVWIPPEAGNRGLVVVSIRQRYPGYARQAALVASQVAGAAYLGRFVVIVDDDIDIWNMNDVWWAVLSRCDPQRDIEFLHRTWSGPLDQAIVPEERGLNSRAILDATIPWEWRDQFPPVVVEPELARATREQWSWLLDR